ncbi:MAG: phosphate/phosphite/phosphonate ABC transporter substrate-binding protein, partial [Brevefilum sp.]
EQSPTPTQTPTPRPTATPTLPPLGSTGNPITVGFILQETNNADLAAEDLAGLIGRETGYVMEAFFYPDFQSLSQAILNDELDLFWLRPLEYLFLNGEGAAEVMLMTNHLGVYGHGVQLIANNNSGFRSYFNPETGENMGEFLDALQQFSGTRPCFLDPQSIPGNFVPTGLLANASTPTLDPVFVYSYNAVIRALYIRGICDFGVTYALTGDPFTASDILLNLPDAREQITTIWQSDGIIPNMNLSASPSLPTFIRFRLEEAVLRIADTPDGLNLISTALDYQVEAMRSAQDSVYNPFRAVIIPLALNFPTILYETPQQ